MSLRPVASALVAAVGLLASVDALALDAACPYGVNAHQASNAALDMAEAAGISWVRFDMNWLQFEPSKGNFDWTEADRFINHASSKGLSVFVTVAYTPMWAVGAACNDADPNPVNHCLNRVPANVGDWTDFLTAAVNRYGGTVKHWGMWNEPNLLHFFNGTRPQYVSQILEPGSNAVHAACADCKVLGPELANLRGSANWDANEGTCIANNCIFNGWNHSLREILKVAAGSLDVITHHKYGDPASGWWTEVLDGSYDVIKVADGVKEITDAHAPGKPVWLTELGWESQPFGSYTNAYAATQLSTIYQGREQVKAGTFAGATNQPWPELEKVFWYDLHDDPNGYSWGLLDSSLGVKEPYTAYQQVIASLGPCVDPGTGGGGVGGGTTGSGAGGAGSGAAGAGVGGSGASSGSGTGAGANGAAAGEASESGCACRTTGSRSDRSGWLVFLLAALGLSRRRLSRRRSGRTAP